MRYTGTREKLEALGRTCKEITPHSVIEYNVLITMHYLEGEAAQGCCQCKFQVSLQIKVHRPTRNLVFEQTETRSNLLD